jgi:hypothetical protein
MVVLVAVLVVEQDLLRRLELELPIKVITVEVAGLLKAMILVVVVEVVLERSEQTEHLPQVETVALVLHQQ